MGKFLIEGGYSLQGEVNVKSAKNSMLSLIPACCLIDGKVTFLNVEKLGDIMVMLEIIKSLGGDYSFNGENLTVDCSKLYTSELPEDLTCKIRSSVFLLGPLIGRFRKATIKKSGGCNIGERPIDIHLNGFRKLGVECVDSDVLFCKADKLVGAEITLRYKSVGATENLIMAAVLAKGTTVIKNAAKEPEVKCLAEFLKKFGAKISGAGSDLIIIEGVEKLNAKDITFMPISDRIEAGTFILAGLITGGELLINNVDFSGEATLIKKVHNNACKIGVYNDKIYIKSKGRGRSLGVIKTAPYPYFPTDLQTPVLAYASTLNGLTIIEETVFPERFNQVEELKKMGADIKVISNKAIVEGVSSLYGESVYAHDLRGGAAMVLAGLSASGTTILDNVEVIDRGYYMLDKKLQALGAKIKRS